MIVSYDKILIVKETKEKYGGLNYETDDTNAL